MVCDVGVCLDLRARGGRRTGAVRDAAEALIGYLSESLWLPYEAIRDYLKFAKSLSSTLISTVHLFVNGWKARRKPVP